MKKSIKILAGSIAFLLIIGILYFANGFLGNPISKMMANNTSRKYIEKNYPDMELEISNAYYSFKSGDYCVQVKSPISKDTNFSLTISPFGKLIYDSYEYDVVSKYNTLHRIDSSYNTKIKSVFESKNFPYKSDIYFGEIRDKSLNEEDEYFYPDYGLDVEKLELDKDYDINSIGKKAGHIVFYTQYEEVCIKKASEILLNIKDILDKENISFYAIDFTLEKPRGDDGMPNEDDTSISVEQFLYSDIYMEDLEKRILKASKDLKKHYEMDDSKKLEELSNQ